ncbi:ubiquitin carboxyl-terminal hydrolase isozyme L3, putative [Plasmodium knowlesi strain H]|uniref:Ubiquitin carboxyl-terminal hydrolase n=3 Tax=Plasmodium knowlesi TaxID=5850 RepID=A0A5K1VPL7_PLAKH|nr:ubiquitin carboxyl-terminal hydrolase isozyme L3, putative [Plasmodium knowlesi strain H]OTN65279.1 Ubiquitin carboxyl-terminal hydrolase [Plasmodium knowlesi]CAA9989541.1 ubiquitin carboxyl-terminal hydrolase isozyme L3, putative [Plasmodium knowlesi strain H]SBO22549.1 ubiquitin carboxyl-terminal hydrolase isozyme L3, putative [Plasmodium knowlesi strain H]SBO23579.1 ubiquitin carboxyl-terminal hydrolase isozyme L3, putative [Plasmodium knowlesi strain H]VVS79015.1 ubiquitin carboxyl-term|eukprot:XP_002260266.1 ubiquitin carboxyl-terminal hydrolase, putative [Plasmodium knowlesi strain H]
MLRNNIWVPIESNPESLYLYSCKLGQTKLIFQDIYGFDAELLDMIPQPVHAIILLYPLKEGMINPNDEANGSTEQNVENIWFIKQIVPNSCGTVALFHLYGNLRNKFELDKDSLLANFFDRVKDMTPEKRGKEFEVNKSIELLHHEFSGKASGTGDDIDVDTHFIVFVEIDGKLVELDGRKDNPVIHCTTTPATFKYDTGNIIKKKFIEKCQGDNRFSALAVVSSDVV